MYFQRDTQVVLLQQTVLTFQNVQFQLTIAVMFICMPYKSSCIMGTEHSKVVVLNAVAVSAKNEPTLVGFHIQSHIKSRGPEN